MRNLLLTQSPLLVFTLLLLFLSISSLISSPAPFLIYLFLILPLLFYFYRFPKRRQNLSKPNDITSPSDGTITNIITDKNKQQTTISIFLSPLDVHIQYIPYTGTVINQIYKPGTFHPAYLFRKSQYNESNTIVLQPENRPASDQISVKQIAGLLARRITTNIPHNAAINSKNSHKVKRGEPYGMIKLSSRVDITLPNTAHIMVSKGERVKGCETVIAKFIKI